MRILPGDETKEGDGNSNVFTLPLPERINSGATMDRQNDSGDSGYLITEGTVENSSSNEPVNSAKLSAKAIGILIELTVIGFLIGCLLFVIDFVAKGFEALHG